MESIKENIMTKEQLKNAVNLDKELKYCKEIKDTISKEDQHWWSFKTPNNEILLPDNLREKFSKLVDNTILELEKEIDNL